MRNACDSDPRCGLACDVSARDAKSLAMPRVEQCEPLRTNLCFIYITGEQAARGSALVIVQCVHARSERENVAEIYAPSPDTSLRLANLPLGNPRYPFFVLLSS